MNVKNLNYFDIESAKKVFDKGGNVTEHLRSQLNIKHNTPEIIEAAYDLQAGSYIEYVSKNFAKTDIYTNELASILSPYVMTTDNVLDVGCGELTTISYVLKKLSAVPKKVFAFDVSWSRLSLGVNFSQKVLAESAIKISCFVGDMHHIPLQDKSIAITTSSHALEPNGGSLPSILEELFRVTSRYLILFEPCYEINSKEGKERMDNLGYIKNLPGEVEKLGGTLVEQVAIKSNENPLNPTYCFIIRPPKFDNVNTEFESDIYSIPGTNQQIAKVGNFYFSKKSGVAFPILEGIPILRKNSFILASALTSKSE